MKTISKAFTALQKHRNSATLLFRKLFHIRFGIDRVYFHLESNGEVGNILPDWYYSIIHIIYSYSKCSFRLISCMSIPVKTKWILKEQPILVDFLEHELKLSTTISWNFLVITPKSDNSYSILTDLTSL